MGARSQGRVSSLSGCPTSTRPALAPRPQVYKGHRILLGPVGIHSPVSACQGSFCSLTTPGSEELVRCPVPRPFHRPGSTLGPSSCPKSPPAQALLGSLDLGLCGSERAPSWRARRTAAVAQQSRPWPGRPPLRPPRAPPLAGSSLGRHRPTRRAGAGPTSSPPGRVCAVSGPRTAARRGRVARDACASSGPWASRHLLP